MSSDRHDDDVIVISDEDVRYETQDENDAADPAGASAHDDLAANDQATQAVPSETGRFGTMTAAGDDATPGDADTDTGTHPVTEPVTPAASSGTGSAIPMPGADAPSTATPAASEATPAASEAAPDSSWPQIQSLFVDDPHGAVRQAADVAGGALAALVAAASNREQTLRDSWQGDSTGTEELRTALRDYRDLAARLSALSKDL